MADLKPVYLVCGDDDAKVDAWRARVRARAETERGPGGLESFDANTVPPERVAAALAELTFDTGTRYLLVDDAGAWKAAQLEALEQGLAQPVPDTVLVLVVRGKPLKGLTKIVESAGGECRDHGDRGPPPQPHRSQFSTSSPPGPPTQRSSPDPPSRSSGPARPRSSSSCPLP